MGWPFRAVVLAVVVAEFALIPASAGRWLFIGAALAMAAAFEVITVTAGRKP